MRKAIELREYLAQHVPALRRHPDRLHCLIPKGSVAIKRGASSSYEYRYTLEILAEDYSDPADTLIVPLIAWIDTNQPDLIDNIDKRDKAIGIEAEIISHSAADILISLELSERVIVTPSAAGYDCEHVGEPPLPDLSGPSGWSIFVKGELFAEGTGP